MLYLQALLSRGVLLILEACGSLEILKPRLFVTSFPLTLECLYKEWYDWAILTPFEARNTLSMVTMVTHFTVKLCSSQGDDCQDRQGWGEAL